MTTQPTAQTLRSKFKLRNNRLISIRTNKLAGTVNGTTRWVQIDGARHRYDDILALYKSIFTTSPSPSDSSIPHIGRHSTVGRFSARIYENQMTFNDMLFGAVFVHDVWAQTQWNHDGTHPTNPDYDLL